MLHDSTERFVGLCLRLDFLAGRVAAHPHRGQKGACTFARFTCFQHGNRAEGRAAVLLAYLVLDNPIARAASAQPNAETRNLLIEDDELFFLGGSSSP
jgi:hypothetical protein